MSVTTDSLEAGLRAHLLGGTALVALLAGTVSVYREELPPDAELPAVVYSRDDGAPLYRFADSYAREATYVVRGITAGHSALTAGSIDAALEARLADARFTVSGGTVLYCRRERDVDYPEQAPGGIRYNHRGGLFRLWTT